MRNDTVSSRSSWAKSGGADRDLIASPSISADAPPAAQAKKILIAYAPYKNGVHRMHTDLAWPWLIGYRRPPYWQDWWAYVDIDTAEQSRATE